MLDKPKRKTAGVAPLRQSPRQAVPSSAPSTSRNQAAPVNTKFFTVKLDGPKPGSAERVRFLVPALKNLLGPNFKKFVSELGMDGNNVSKIKIDDARKVLAEFTDSPVIKKMAEERIDNKQFIAAVLDYAQEALDLPTEPRASTVAIVENKEDNTIDILSHKLHELGMYPESWKIPLTAARMKKKNRPNSRGEDTPAVKVEVAEQEEEAAVEAEEEPAEGKKQKRRKKKSKKGVLEEEEEEVKEKEEEAGPSKRREVPPPEPEPEPAAEATTSSAADGKLTFRVGTGNSKFSKKIKNFVTGLKIILPQAADKLDTAAGLGKDAAYKEINAVLGQRVPQVDDEALSHPIDYFRKLMIWAVEAMDGTNGSEVANARLEPGKWRLPLYAEQMRTVANKKAAFKLAARDSKKKPPAAAAPPAPADATTAAAAGSGRGRGRKKRQEEDVPVEVPVVEPISGKKRGRKPKNEDLNILVAAAAMEEEEGAAPAPAAAVGRGGRRVSSRNVGKPALKIEDEEEEYDDDGYLVSKAPKEEEDYEEEEETEEEEEEEPRPAAKRARLSIPKNKPKPTDTTVQQAGPSRASRNAYETTNELTSAERQSCYWLQRTGQKAERFRGDQRRNPPPGVQATDLISCHDCQAAHIRHECQGDCIKSYCQQCCRHYEYLFSSQPGDVLEPLLEEFCKGVCPCCLDICARKDCLRKRSKVYKLAPQVPELDKEERKVMALHMARCLADVQKHFADIGDTEAQRQDTTVAAAKQLPSSSVDFFRLLCNRCATSMENMIVHCRCGADFCPQCCADLMGHEKGPLRCPVCTQSTTTIQRVLPVPTIKKLNDTQAVVDKTVARGGAAVNAYDYNCKLWRLPTAADAKVKGNKGGDANGNGASGSKAQVQQQSCMPNGNNNGVPVLLSAAPRQQQQQQQQTGARAPPPAPSAVYTGRVLGQPDRFMPSNGAPVLQSTATTVAVNNNTAAAAAAGAPSSLPPTSTALLAQAARYRGIDALALQLLERPATSLSAEHLQVLSAVFNQFCIGEYRFGPQLRNPELASTVMQQMNALRHLLGTSSTGGNGTAGNGNGIGQLLGIGGGSNGAGPSTAAAAPAPAPAPAPAAAVVGPNLVRLPERPVTRIPNCINLIDWHKDLPPEDYRIASNRPDGVQNYIWTPHVSDFSPTSPRRHETVERFVQRWAAGEPIIIRGMRGRVNWGPNVVMRAARDMKVGLKDIAVTDCSDWGSELQISAESFFRMYTACHGPTHDANGSELSMYKLKDFPPEDTFVNRCKRHNDDFLEMLNSCMPEYMHPNGGVLNLASKLPPTAVPPDLGPKGYIAFGREEEKEGGEGDSVTRLHEDLSDAINILCHVQHPPGTKTPPVARCGDSPINNAPSFGGAGALWDLYRREDIPVLRRFILDVVAGTVKSCPGFYYKGKKLTLEDIKDPVHDQAIMLTASHRAVAAQPPYNLQSWLIEQYEFEGVVIPAACAHQVRNLRSCIKIALDFVSPESVPHCLAQREERRVLAMEEVNERGGALDSNEVIEQRHFHDKLQVVNMAVHGLTEALDVLESDEKGSKNSKRKK